MKYSILGFNQEKIVNYLVNDDDKILKCDLTDLLILNYIIYAQANPKLLHEDNYVWLQHEHIREDLPILNITEGTLKNRLTKLRKMNLIDSVVKANDNGQGTKTFYATTSFCYDMVFESTSLKNDVVDEARHSKMTSNNKQLDNKKVEDSIINNTIVVNTNSQNFTFGTKQTKPKKQNLYSRCVALINNKTDDKELQKLLVDWLNMLLEKYKDREKVLYENVFKGKLNTLDEYDKKDWKNVIQYNLQRGYEAFYPLKEYKHNDMEVISSEYGIVNSYKYTDEERKRQEEWRAEMKRNGKRIEF